MKTTLNTIGIVEKIMELIEGNKKNAVVNGILVKSFLNGYAFSTLAEMVSEKEMKNIRDLINDYKKEQELTEYYLNTEEEIDNQLMNKNVLNIKNDKNEKSNIENNKITKIENIETKNKFFKITYKIFDEKMIEI